jgi:hypothetical protein
LEKYLFKNTALFLSAKFFIPIFKESNQNGIFLHDTVCLTGLILMNRPLSLIIDSILQY